MEQKGSIPIRPFRADDWWTSKASLLMGFVYLFALWFRIPFEHFLPLAFFSVVVIAGFASFGYLVNDFFDKEKDRQAGKKNFLLDKPVIYQTGLTALSITFIVAPWFFLPADRLSYTLIGFQISLFMIYSWPPIRLKEKGAAGVLVDSLYAHATPVVLAAYTFFLASFSPPDYTDFLLLFGWQLLCGIRNILIHQIEDKASDIQSQTRTYGNTIAKEKVFKLLQFVVLVELLLCLAFFSFLALDNHWLGLCGAVVFVLCFQKTFWYIHLTEEGLPEPPLRYFPNNIYEKCLPLLYLIILSFSNVYFIILFFAHVTLFNFGLYRNTIQIAMRIWHGMPLGYFNYHILVPIRIFISRGINYMIYYSLLIVGIDLKKEKMSAIDYFKKKWGSSH